LLAGWEHDCWTQANLARLRVLACDRAFEAGLEVQDLLPAVRQAPALAEVLGARDSDGLVRLRLLWSLRSSRPWDQFGGAATAFEVAADPREGQRLLGPHPDLLLAAGEEPRVLVCGWGLIYRDVVFATPPERVEVQARWQWFGTRYEIVVGGQRLTFPDDPEVFAVRLERWIRFFFGEFLPQTSAVPFWKAPVPVTAFGAGEVVRCPECGRAFRSRLGTTGSAACGLARGNRT
jgi:hypothetical protein